LDAILNSGFGAHQGPNEWQSAEQEKNEAGGHSIMVTEQMVTLCQDRNARVRLLQTQMAHKTKEIGWDDANLQDPVERGRFTEQELEKARARRRKVVADLQKQGLIDSQGRRVSNETPADMRPDSKCTLPG
jgi:hypothetical protein